MYILYILYILLYILYSWFENFSCKMCEVFHLASVFQMILFTFISCNLLIKTSYEISVQCCLPDVGLMQYIFYYHGSSGIKHIV